jgi:hypothetical protein
LREDGTATFLNHRVTTLPSGLTGGSVRAGSIMTAGAAGASDSRQAQLGGHREDSNQLASSNSHWNYVTSLLLNIITVAVPGLGWPHLGDVYKRTPLAPTLVSLGFSREQLSFVQDDLFRIDTAILPRLARDGDLRPLLDTCLATMLMYYPELDELSTRAHSRGQTVLRLQGAFTSSSGARAALFKKSEVDAGLRALSGIIKTRFETANLPCLAGRFDDAGQLEQNTVAISQLGANVSELNTKQ